MLALMIAQLCLGFVAFSYAGGLGHDAVQPELPMVVSTVAHVAVERCCWLQPRCWRCRCGGIAL